MMSFGSPSAPAVSVVVPTKDRAFFLKDCLAALTAQQYRDLFEVVIVDDASTDGTRPLVLEVIERTTFPAISYVRHSTSKGPAAARNHGVARTAGDLICFIDDDILPPVGWLTEMVAGWKRHPDKACFAGRILLTPDGKPPRTCGKEPLGESGLDLGESEHEIRHGLTGGNMGVPRSTFVEFGGFDETLDFYGEDTEWQHRLHRAGGETIYLPDAWVHHRRTADELKVRKILRRQFRKGKSWPVVADRIERRSSPFGGLRIIVTGLAHALRHRCWTGIFRAAYGLGYSTESVIRLVRGNAPAYLRWLPPIRRERG